MKITKQVEITTKEMISMIPTFKKTSLFTYKLFKYPANKFDRCVIIVSNNPETTLSIDLGTVDSFFQFEDAVEIDGLAFELEYKTVNNLLDKLAGMDDIEEDEHNEKIISDRFDACKPSNQESC